MTSMYCRREEGLLKLYSCLRLQRTGAVVGEGGHLLGKRTSWDPAREPPGTGYSATHTKKQVEERRKNTDDRMLGQISPNS